MEEGRLLCGIFGMGVAASAKETWGGGSVRFLSKCKTYAARMILASAKFSVQVLCYTYRRAIYSRCLPTCIVQRPSRAPSHRRQERTSGRTDLIDATFFDDVTCSNPNYVS